MLQGRRDSRRGRNRLKLQGEETQFGCNACSCKVHRESRLQPGGADKSPANAAGAEPVLPWCWAGALAATAPPQAAGEGMGRVPPSPSHGHICAHLVLPSNRQESSATGVFSAVTPIIYFLNKRNSCETHDKNL